MLIIIMIWKKIVLKILLITLSLNNVNSLYGRLGMNPYLPKHLIVNEGEHLKLMKNIK